MNRGITYSIMEQYDQAIDEYNKVIEINPRFAAPITTGGLFIKKGGNIIGQSPITLKPLKWIQSILWLTTTEGLFMA